MLECVISAVGLLCAAWPRWRGSAASFAILLLLAAAYPAALQPAATMEGWSLFFADCNLRLPDCTFSLRARSLSNLISPQGFWKSPAMFAWVGSFDLRPSVRQRASMDVHQPHNARFLDVVASFVRVVL